MDLQPLNLPAFGHKLTETDGVIRIFDQLRRKHVLLTPEEWVRQHLLHYLISYLHYPKALVSVERGLRYNKRQKRSDVVVFDLQGKPLLLVECKAASVKLSPAACEQLAVYNSTLGAPVVAITNGLDCYCWQLNLATRKYEALPGIPAFLASV